MKPALLIVTAALLGGAAAPAFADDVPEPPRTHVDTTVVGSAKSADPGMTTEAANLDNDHQFEAGEPDLLKITNKLQLSVKQKAQVKDAIERADAGAAVLIKREHDVKDMIAATTPQDPLYASLIAQQATGEDRWTENRDRLRRDIEAVLDDRQRTRFEELQAAR